MFHSFINIFGTQGVFYPYYTDMKTGQFQVLTRPT